VLSIRKNGRSLQYTLTALDYLDLLRAVDREGPPKLAVTWTLVQRFGMLYPIYKTLSSFVRAYAQPINPDWFRTGKRHLAAIEASKGNLAAVAAENKQAVLREQWAAVPLEKISPDTVKIVNSIFAGVTSPVPAATHYHAPITRTSIEAAKKARADFAAKRGYSVVETSAPLLSSNWFYGEAAMRTVSVSAVLTVVTGALLALLGTSGFIYALHYLSRRYA
jgi:hypothetical protein